MVYHCQFSHVIRHPFQSFLQHELIRRFELDESHKTKVEVIERAQGNYFLFILIVWFKEFRDCSFKIWQVHYFFVCDTVH